MTTTEVALKDDELYSYNELAGALGVTPKTVASYHRRSRNADYPPHLFPRPSMNFEGKHPRWTWKVVRDWNEQRPGPGWHQEQRTGRTDIYTEGRPVPGDDSGKTVNRKRLSGEQIAAVQAHWSTGWTRAQLAEAFGVSYITIARITKDPHE